MAEQKQDDQLEHTYISYVRIRDIALKTCQRQWTIGRSGERVSGISLLVAWHDDDDDDVKIHLCMMYNWRPSLFKWLWHEITQQKLICHKTNQPTHTHTHTHTHIEVLVLCNSYFQRKWNWWPEFKSWTKLFAFAIVLIPTVTVSIQLFSSQLWVNSRTDCSLI